MWDRGCDVLRNWNAELKKKFESRTLIHIKHPVERNTDNDGRQQQGKDELIRAKLLHGSNIN